ncbi:S-layer family protein, partial [Gilliamella sp. B3172]
ITFDVANGINNRFAELTASGAIKLASLNGHIENQHAKLLSNNGISLQAINIDNQSASFKTNGLVDIKAQQINNRQSHYVAENILLESNALNNQLASLTANNKIIIDAKDFDNDQGYLLSDNLLLKTKSFRGNGTIKTKNDLSLELEDSFVNDSEITANGHLSISSENDIINKNKITAGKQVSLKSQQLINEQQAEISADYLALNHQNATNYGLINGTTAIIDSNTLNNLQTGRIYADNLAINAITLNNRAQNGTAPVIAARQNFHLGVNTLNNYAHAQLLSLGDFIIGGELDEHYNVKGQAELIENHSATIESHGNLFINAKVINNINDHIVTEMRQSDEPPEHEVYFQTSEGEGKTKYSPDEVLYRIKRKGMGSIPGVSCDGRKRCLYKWNDIPLHLRNTKYLQRMYVPSKGINGAANSWHYDIYKQKYRTVLIETDPSKITATGNITIQGQTLNNHDSKIIAGKNVNINVDQLNNISQEVLSKYVYSGRVNLHRRKDEDKYRFSSYKYTKADEEFIDNALNTNILDHQIFEQAQLNDTARQPTTVENTHQHVDINQPVQDSAKQHEKQIDNPHFGHDNTTAVNATIDKQEVITSANTPVDNNIDDHLNQQSQQADHADLATADKDITPPKTISIYEPNLTLPDNSLWIVNKDTDKNYIIETDPNFTQRKKWLSSDYMLSRLKADPDSVLKRLGDGYYEQQLIKEQIVGLTGHRYLQGYENDLAQYQALMDAGISFANQYGIAPGVELSAEQMKALTTDMVLLVKKQVVINNQAIDVLVPQVYIVNRTELSHDGALIAGDNVFIKGQALNSSGLINAKKDIQLSGNNVTNSGTVFGERVAIDAKNDITNYGKLVGDKLVYLSADNDINLLS